MKPSLEAYLRDSCSRNVIDHSIRARVDSDGSLTFYIHPSGVDGDTLDFVVCGNTLIQEQYVPMPGMKERLRSFMAAVEPIWRHLRKQDPYIYAPNGTPEQWTYHERNDKNALLEFDAIENEADRLTAELSK